MPRQTMWALLAVLAVVWPAEGIAQTEVHERAITDAYAAWVVTVNTKDIDTWSSFLAPDAVFFPPDAPVLSDRAAILGFYSALFADPQFALDCRLEKVEVAVGEEMAWAHGRCTASFTDANGDVGQGSTKWLKVWKRQPNGEWKCTANAWNAEPEGSGPG